MPQRHCLVPAPVVALSGCEPRFEPGLIACRRRTKQHASKTTFARVAAGLIRPQSGGVFVGGQPLVAGSVKDARAAGVELVHQCFALPPSFTVAEAMEFNAAWGNRAIFTRGQLAQAMAEAIWLRSTSSVDYRTAASATCRWRHSRAWRSPAPWSPRRAS